LLTHSPADQFGKKEQKISPYMLTAWLAVPEQAMISFHGIFLSFFLYFYSRSLVFQHIKTHYSQKK